MGEDISRLAARFEVIDSSHFSSSTRNVQSHPPRRFTLAPQHFSCIEHWSECEQSELACWVPTCSSSTASRSSAGAGTQHRRLREAGRQPGSNTGPRSAHTYHWVVVSVTVLVMVAVLAVVIVVMQHTRSTRESHRQAGRRVEWLSGWVREQGKRQAARAHSHTAHMARLPASRPLALLLLLL